MIRNVTVRILGKLGYLNVLTAEHGGQAVEQIRASEQPFDIIVCDLNMPEMDGIEFIRHAADLKFSGGIVFVSGEHQRIMETVRDLAKIHELHVLGIIPKPVFPDTLRKVMVEYRPKVRAVAVAQTPIAVEELTDGLDGRHLKMLYQPKVNIRSGKIESVEALVRWQHPARGLLAPPAFISVAEQHGMIDQLSKTIFSMAVAQVAQWQAGGLRLKMSVNFSVNSFMYPGVVDFMVSVPQSHGVDPALLILELTESQVMKDARNCLESLTRLRMKKLGLSLDDFGIGHSSMEQLKRIPFTELKVDRTFVAGATHDASARAMLESCIELGKKLNMQIVAEGVETREDWDLVASLGCDLVQGYYCARPMDAGNLVEFVRNWTGPHK